MTLLALLVAFTVFWEPSPDAGAEYRVYWRDGAPVTLNQGLVADPSAVVVAAGTAASAWVPNPPAGKVRYAVVTAVVTSGTGASAMRLESLASKLVFWPSTKFILEVARNLSDGFSTSLPVMLSTGTSGALQVEFPGDWPSAFLRLRKP